MASDAEKHAAQVAARQELADAGISLPRSVYRSQRQPLNTLLASAQRVTSKTLQRGWGKSEAWQTDAWDMFNLVGENRFLAVTLAQRMSQARFFVGKVAQDPTEEPEPVEDARFTDVLNSIGSSASARAQLIARLGVNLFVAGDGWLVGIPRHLIPTSLMVGTLSEPVVDPGLLPQPEADGTMNIADLDWRMMSISEVSTSGGEVQLRLGATAAETIVTSPDALILIRVWRPHPHRWWEADSPVRSSLPVLRELVGLTMHVSAQIDSRLAGAGMLIVPQSAQRALQIAAGIEDDADTDSDQFTPALMEAMLKPISDRASASAIVPLIVTVPDEACDKFKFISFDKPLDLELRELRAETIRRLALGLDAPPELLLGTGSISHWGAWLVLEDVVKTHLEPPLALICDALTTQYLWPVLVDQGMRADEARQYVIWYDVSDLVVRPTRSADAQAMHAAGVISDAALRAANGFDDSDAPEDPATDYPVEVLMALDMVRANPVLMGNPGLPQLVAQLRAVLSGNIPDLLDPAAQVRAMEVRTDNAIPAAGKTDPALPGAHSPNGAPAAPGRPVGAPVSGPSSASKPSGSTAGPSTPPAPGVPAGGVPAAKLPPRGSIAASAATAPIAAGVAVHAADTGRVLMLQRGIVDPDDPAAGTWEFPGGTIEPGEVPMTAAFREWSEETGHPFPQGMQTGEWTSHDGVYQGFVWEVPSEASVDLNLDFEDRHILNPDDPDGDGIEVIAWWSTDQLRGNPAVRAELVADLDVVLAAIGPTSAQQSITASALRYHVRIAQEHIPTPRELAEDLGRVH